MKVNTREAAQCRETRRGLTRLAAMRARDVTSAQSKTINAIYYVDPPLARSSNVFLTATFARNVDSVDPFNCDKHAKRERLESPPLSLSLSVA